MDLEQILCPAQEGHMRAGARIGNLSIKIPSKIGDMIWTWYSEFMITDRVKNLFEEAGFTGYLLKPVTITGFLGKSRKKSLQMMEERELPVLWELVVTGWAGMAPRESGIKLLESESCPVCGMLRYSGLTDPTRLIDESQWDGSDFFMVWPMPRFIFVSEKVKKFIKANKLTGGSIVPVEKLGCTGDYGFGPGRLSYCMPEDRAHLLGDSLGIF